MSIVISSKVRLVITDTDTSNFDFGVNKATEISILRDITLDRSMLSIGGSSSGVSSTPNRVSKTINTGYTGVDFSFSSYLKPITDSGNVTSPEKLLWESLSATNVADTVIDSTVAFTSGNTNKLRELFFFIIFDNGNYYKVSNAVVASATIDLDINTIAKVNWKVIGLNMEYIKAVSSLEAGANLILYSEALDNATNWIGGIKPVITADTDLSPTSTLTADTLDDQDIFYRNITQDFDSQFNNTNYYCFSLHVKKDAIGRATRFPAVQAIFGPVVPETNYIKLDTSNGALSIVGPSTLGVSGVVDLGTYWRVYAAFKSASPSNSQADISIVPAQGAGAGWTLDNTTTGSIVAWGVQVSEGNVLQNYVKTVGSEVLTPLTGTPKVLTNAVHVRNKLSTIALQIGASVYDLAILSANISISNSVNLINRVKIGEIMTASGHYVEDRNVSIAANFYLNTKTLGSSTLSTDLLSYTTLDEINTLSNVTLSIGGSSNALRVDLLMPTSKVSVTPPTVGLYNTVDILISPQESVFGAGDELSLVYNN